MSLHRSFDNLENLRRKIEDDLIPGMIIEADKLAQIDPVVMTDIDLAAEIKRRWEINQRWANIYWDEFIPFAHGVRLFGQVYNDVLHPDDPYEFIDLLTHTEMVSLERNKMLEELADRVRRDSSLADQLENRINTTLCRPILHKKSTPSSKNTVTSPVRLPAGPYATKRPNRCSIFCSKWPPTQTPGPHDHKVTACQRN